MILFPLVTLQRTFLRAVKCSRYIERGTNVCHLCVVALHDGDGRRLELIPSQNTFGASNHCYWCRLHLLISLTMMMTGVDQDQDKVTYCERSGLMLKYIIILIDGALGIVPPTPSSSIIHLPLKNICPPYIPTLCILSSAYVVVVTVRWFHLVSCVKPFVHTCYSGCTYIAFINLSCCQRRRAVWTLVHIFHIFCASNFQFQKPPKLQMWL